MKKFLLPLLLLTTILCGCENEGSRLCNFTIQIDEDDPLTVVLVNTSIDLTDFSWYYGDDDFRLIFNDNIHRHTYKKAGTYEITLTGVGGNKHYSKSKTITLSDKPTTKPDTTSTDTIKPDTYADFAFVTNQLKVDFVNLSSNNLSDFYWDYGDQSGFDFQLHGYHQYKQSGTYYVTLFGFDKDDKLYSKMKKVTVEGEYVEPKLIKDETYIAGFELVATTYTKKHKFELSIPSLMGTHDINIKTDYVSVSSSDDLPIRYILKNPVKVGSGSYPFDWYKTATFKLTQSNLGFIYDPILTKTISPSDLNGLDQYDVENEAGTIRVSILFEFTYKYEDE